MMSYLLVLGLAALPAAGNFAGGLWAEWRPPSPRALNIALHAAAGIVLAVVAVEIMPRALDSLLDGRNRFSDWRRAVHGSGGSGQPPAVAGRGRR